MGYTNAKASIGNLIFKPQSDGSVIVEHRGKDVMTFDTDGSVDMELNSDLTGNQTISGTLDVTGAVTASSTVAVTGEITGSAGIEVATGAVVGFDGTVTADKIQLGDADFFLDFDSGTEPVLNFDSGTDAISFIRGSNSFDFNIANTAEMRLLTSGLRILNGLYVGSTSSVPTDNDITLDGDVIAPTGAVLPGTAGTSWREDKVSLSNSEIKNLAATPKVLVAAPGATEYVIVECIDLVLNAGSEALSEAADNLVLEYVTSGDDIIASIETTGWIDQTVDQFINGIPAAQTTNVMSDLLNNAVQLRNLGAGAGEFAGNASADATIDVYIKYRIVTTA